VAIAEAVVTVSVTYRLCEPQYPNKPVYWSRLMVNRTAATLVRSGNTSDRLGLNTSWLAEAKPVAGKGSVFIIHCIFITCQLSSSSQTRQLVYYLTLVQRADYHNRWYHDIVQTAVHQMRRICGKQWTMRAILNKKRPHSEAPRRTRSSCPNSYV